MNSSITAILVSRFLMDLQEANNAACQSHSQPSAISNLCFNRVIGSIGSTLGEPVEIANAPAEQVEDTPSHHGDMPAQELREGDVSSRMIA